MGQLSAALRAELQRPAHRAHFVLELIGTAGGTLRLTSEAVSSMSLGHAWPWVARWGRLTRAASTWRGGLQAATFSADVDDLDGRLTSGYGSSFEGLRARLWLWSRAASDAGEYALLFDGVVDTAPTGGPVVSFALRTRDAQLETQVSQGAVTTFAWKNMARDSKSPAGQGIPIVLGVHDALGYAGDKGMLRAGLVDATNFRYLAAAGSVQVMRVYSAGTLVDPDDYSIVETRGNDLRSVTLIDFATDQGDNEVTFDAAGFTDAATDPPELLARPVAQAQLLLDSFVSGDWKRGPWLATALVSAAHAARADAFLAALGHSGSYYVPPERKSGSAIVQALCTSFELAAFWTTDGLIAFAAFDHRLQGDMLLPGPGSPDPTLSECLVIDVDRLPGQTSPPKRDPQAATQRVRVRAGLRANGGQYLHERLVQISSNGPIRDVNADWTPASALVGVYMAKLVPDATLEAGFNPGGGAATVHEALAQGGGYVTSLSTSSINRFRVSLSSMPDAVSIEKLELVALVWDVVGISALDTVKGFYYDGSTYHYAETVVTDPGPDPFEVRFAFPADPGASAPWTKAAIDAGSFGLEYNPHGTDRLRVDYFWGEAPYYPAANANSPAPLDIGSRILNRFREAPVQLTVVGGLEWLDLELLDLVPVAWRRLNWGPDPARRAPHFVVGIDLDMATHAVTLTLEDARPMLTTFRLDARASAEVVPYAVGLGVGLVTHGGAYTVTGGPTAVDSPAGEGVQEAGPVVILLERNLPCGRLGLHAERTGTNLQPQSSFKNGLTGWTASPGANGATITADASPEAQLFADPNVSDKVLLLKRGTPHTSASTAPAPVTDSVEANTLVCISVDHWDANDYTDPVAIRISRGVDGYYWDVLSGWSDRVKAIALPFAATWSRWVSPAFDVGASATTLHVIIVQPIGGTGGSQNIVGHVQIDDKPWASTRIVTQATAVTRPAHTVSFDNDAAADPGEVTEASRFLWPPERGTWEFELISDWNASEVAAGTAFVVFHLEYNADRELFHLAYVVGTGWCFRVVHDGAEFDAVADAPGPTRGVPFRVVVRWTSALGECDRPPGTATLVVYDAGGAVAAWADSTFETAPVYSAGAKFDLGHMSPVPEQQWSGIIVSARVYPLPRSDKELGIA